MNMKTRWLLVFTAISLLRGLIFPDYRNDYALWVIPFITPAVCAIVAILAWLTKKLTLQWALSSGFLAVLLSDVIGTIVYGMQAGWRYVTHDTETHAVLLLTLFIQIISFSVIYSALFFLIKIFRKVKRPT
jgi:hypothetical protein